MVRPRRGRGWGGCEQTGTWRLFGDNCAHRGWPRPRGASGTAELCRNWSEVIRNYAGTTQRYSGNSFVQHSVPTWQTCVILKKRKLSAVSTKQGRCATRDPNSVQQVQWGRNEAGTTHMFSGTVGNGPNKTADLGPKGLCTRRGPKTVFFVKCDSYPSHQGECFLRTAGAPQVLQGEGNQPWGNWHRVDFPRFRAQWRGTTLKPTKMLR